MPEQQQILRLAVSDAPADYPVASNVELILKQVNAAIDGSGAASAYLPAVVLLSDSGHVIGRYVNRGEPIAAGASAEVTWFPGGGLGGGGSGAVVAWGFIQGSGATTTVTGDPATGNPTRMTWDATSFGEDGSGVFFFDPLAPEYLQCSISPAPGYFTSIAVVEHNPSVPNALNFGDVRVGFTSEAPTNAGPELTNVKGVQGSNIGDPTLAGPEYGWGIEAWWASRGDTTPIGWFVEVENFNGGGADLIAQPVRFSVALVAA